MSAFLGPIHYWLYRKITLQQEVVNEIIALAEEKGLKDLGKTLDEKYGILENRPLEEMIDEGNIHGWLQQRVSLVEYKLADSVTCLLAAHPEAMEEMKKVFCSEGEKVGTECLRDEEVSMGQLFKGMTDSLLDGMPCDHALALMEQDDNKVVWTRTTCVHAPYWEAVDGDIANYYTLREAWLNGFAYSTGTSFEKINDRTYTLKRGN